MTCNVTYSPWRDFLLRGNLSSRRVAPSRRRCRRRFIPQVEALDCLNLLSSLGLDAPLSSFWAIESDDTPAQAAPVDLDAVHSLSGMVGDGAAGAADVDWFRVHVDRPTALHISGGSSRVVISLFEGGAAPDEIGDYHLVTQSGPTAGIEPRLAAGTYFIAVSGAGNCYFHPALVGSGYSGETGRYDLSVDAESLPTDPADDGPEILDFALGTALDPAPVMLRVRLSEPIADDSVVPGRTVLLLGPRGESTFTCTVIGSELIISPDAPLSPGNYRLVVRGSGATDVLRDVDGQPLGFTPETGSGNDRTIPFEVGGIEGTQALTANDTRATAEQLGRLDGAGLIQRTGWIGDDATDPVPLNPSDVDFYQFRIAGSGSFTLGAEVFAGRVGSSLDAGLSLFRVDARGRLVWLANASASGSTAVAEDGTLPLADEPILFAGLSAGSYVVAVTSAGNEAGMDGGFDPQHTHSGRAGGSTGSYVLNLWAALDTESPTVVASQPANGSILPAPPERFEVAFSEPLPLRSSMTAVVVNAAGRVVASARLASFEPEAGVAQFAMIDALPVGAYGLHLRGFGDFASHRLIANDASGDYVIPFTVAGPERGTAGNPLLRTFADSGDGFADLGTLFPAELVKGVVLKRDGSSEPAPTVDAYRFRVLDGNEYTFLLDEHSSAVNVELFDANGERIDAVRQGTGAGLKAILSAGTFELRVTTSGAGDVPTNYGLTLRTATLPEDPTPLRVGPAPALRWFVANERPEVVAAPSFVQRVTVVAARQTEPVAARAPLPEVARTPTGPYLSLSDRPRGDLVTSRPSSERIALAGLMLSTVLTGAAEAAPPRLLPTGLLAGEAGVAALADAAPASSSKGAVPNDEVVLTALFVDPHLRTVSLDDFTDVADSQSRQRPSAPSLSLDEMPLSLVPDKAPRAPKVLRQAETTAWPLLALATAIVSLTAFPFFGHERLARSFGASLRSLGGWTSRLFPRGLEYLPDANHEPI